MDETDFYYKKFKCLLTPLFLSLGAIVMLWLVCGELRPTVVTSRDVRAHEYYSFASSSASAQERLLLAFYYPWYYLSDWSSPDMLDAPFFPYDSSNPLALARHITWTQAAELDGLIVSWWGSESFTDDNLATFLDSLSGADLHATIYFETLSPHFDSPDKVISELEYVLDSYSSHPNFFWYAGRPVIFVYAVQGVPIYGGMTPYLTWQMIVDQLHADGYNPLLIGDAMDSLYLDIFDGLHPYLARYDPAIYQDISCSAHQLGKLWVADIYPGYDDHLLDRPTHLYIPRNAGQTYSDTFTAALQTNPDWIVVTSFNEWWENTHIEPGALYGYDYLSQTAGLSARFHAWHTLSTVYVDAAFVGPEDGSAAQPFNTLQEAVLAAAGGASVRVATGLYTGPLTLTHSITLEGGYDSSNWMRRPGYSANRPSILQGGGAGPVVRVIPGLCAPPSVVLDGLTITGGMAEGSSPSGGGVFADGQGISLTLINSTVTANRAQTHGGGLFVGGGSRLTLQASRVLSNLAAVGGGLFVGDQSQLWLTNTLVADNQATVLGGGLYAHPAASSSIINSTLADNQAPSSGQGLYAWPLPGQSVAVTNSIVWDGGDVDLKCLGNCTLAYSDVAGGAPGPGNLDTDPRFYDPNRGDYHLRHDSPAVDAGDPTGVRPGGPAPTTDIDGDPRPLGTGVDMGSDEVGPLAASALSVDKALASAGDTLRYTLTLTNMATSSLIFHVTDTLPALTDYVSGSLNVSGGAAFYDASGTLALPRILWTGTATPAQALHLSFAVTIDSSATQTAPLCADVLNTAQIQADLGPVGRAMLERSAITRLSDGLLQRLDIQDTAGGAGRSVIAHTLRLGETLTVYAAGYDNCDNYLGPVLATWRTSGTLEYQAGIGDSFTFAPGTIGLGTIVADDGLGHIAETGPITVVFIPPDLHLSPPTLSATLPLDQWLTRTLTLSNEGGLALTYEVVSVYTQPFEVIFQWDEAFFIDLDNSSGQTLWDYYLSPAQVDPWFAGAQVQVTEIELQTTGVNLANWINWDWEVHLSERDIGLPGGQFWDSLIGPGSGYERDAPIQLQLVIGEQQNPNSYEYWVKHNFQEGTTTASPFYNYVKYSRSTPLQLSDGLHVQVFAWTGDSRVTVQFDSLQLTVRGWMTRTFSLADWLTVTPISGTLAPGGHQVFDVGFNSTQQAYGSHTSAIAIHSNDPDVALSIVPVTLTISQARLYLPVMMRNGSFR